jgi:hypothetical protein
LKDNRPVGIPDLARAVGCSPENLNQSDRFMKGYDLLTGGMNRAVPGWKEKDSGNVEAVDDSNEDEDANF